MEKKIKELAHTLQEKSVNRRRDFHRYAETAWTEFRTSSVIADTLEELGYEVLVGDQIIDHAAMMGVPSERELKSQMERALTQGAKPRWVEKMSGGKTGVVGILHCKQPGPVIAFRFDIDANDATEAEDPNHRPHCEKFVSINKGAQHACAHDGHAAIGLTVAEILVALRDDLNGTVKLIFQPAEEGVRGAKSMVAKGIVDDVDYLMGLHLGVSLRKTGQIACRTEGFLATTKIDATFTGIPAHAGAAPETGRNAILAAATAVLNLHAISRHSQGISRINVGIIQGGTGRNVIPANAVLKLETRGIDTVVNEYMLNEALRILKAAAVMQEVEVELKEMGSASGCVNDPELVSQIRKVAENTNIFNEILETGNIGGSEDCSYLMERVQQRGGKAAYIMIGTELASGHHDFHFDINEKALELAVAFIGCMAVELLKSRYK